MVDCEPLPITENNSCGYMEILKYENESTFYDWTGKKNRLRLDLSTYYMHDTAVIVCDQISEFNLKIGLINDSCLIVFNTVELIHDKPNFWSGAKLIMDGNGKVPCLKKSLKLSRKPPFTVGELIEGIFEFESDYYWYLKKEDNKRYRVKLKATFKVEMSANRIRK